MKPVQPNAHLANADPGLINALRERNLVVFGGAGYSVDQPSCLPTFDQLRTLILGAFHGQLEAGPIDADAVREAIDILRSAPMLPEDFFQILADSYNLTNLHPRDSFTNDFCQVFNKPYFNSNHLVIARLAKRGLLRYIITTNFDVCFENALKSVGLKEGQGFYVYRKYEDYSSFNRTNGSSDRSIHIFKLHGSADEIESIRITHRHVRAGLHPDVKQAIAKVLEHRVLFIAGYSGRDQDVYPFLVSQVRSSHVLWLAHPGTDTTWISAQLKHLSGVSRGSRESAYSLVTARLSDLLQDLVQHLGIGDTAATCPSQDLIKRKAAIERELCEFVEDIFDAGVYYILKALAGCHERFGRDDFAMRFLNTIIVLANRNIGGGTFATVEYSDTRNWQEHLFYILISCMLDLARIYYKHGYHNEGLNLAQQSLERFQNPRVSIQLADREGRIREITDVPLLIQSQLVANRVLAQIYLSLAQGYIAAGDFDEGRHCCHIILEQKPECNPEMKSLVYANLMQIASTQQNWDLFWEYGNLGRRYAQQCWWSDHLLNIDLTLITRVLQQKLDFDILSIIEECIGYVVSSLNHVGHGIVLVLLAEYYGQKGQRRAFVETARQLIRIIDANSALFLEDREFAVSIYTMGFNLINWGESALGLPLIEFSVEILSHIGDPLVEQIKESYKNLQRHGVSSQPALQIITGGIRIIHEGSSRLLISRPDVVEFEDITIYPPKYPSGTTIIVDVLGNIRQIDYPEV